MQNVSKAYKDSINTPFRNRAYIRVTIGVINSEAQKNIIADETKSKFTFFSNLKKPFENEIATKLYATCEENYSKIDGKMYFLPLTDEYNLYNNGIVTDNVLDSIYISFQGITGLDIKGLTIDFGDCYPTNFTVQNDEITRSYENNSRYFVTEDVFNGTSFLIITPLAMVGGQDRLRIYQFSCGIVNTFTNKEVLNYSFKEFVSSITETIPSGDLSLSVDNQDMYYSPDNPESTLAYLEVGQEVKTEFGYDVSGLGDVEWLPPITTYMKTWSADDKQAKFTAVDRFDYITGTYYKGLYRANGITLYDLAVDVFVDAGIGEDEYFIDPYLKDIVVHNPMPAVQHTEALQIIANAGRCVLCQDRQNKIRLQSSFVPDMTASVNNETEYSHGANVVVDDTKDAYAIASNDFSLADGSIFFMAADENYLNTGYISNSIADENGFFEENPKITINLEAGFTSYGLLIRFRNVAPQEFVVTTYYEDVLVNSFTVKNPELEYSTNEQFNLFDRMEIEFTKGYSNSRITVDNVLVGDVTDYVLKRNGSLLDYPVAERQSKIKSINVVRSNYNNSTEESKELLQEEIILNVTENVHTVYFQTASYDLSVLVPDNSNVSVDILESSNYFAILRFNGISTETVVKYVVYGKEYKVNENIYSKSYNSNGEEITWNNPLISDIYLARDLEEWLASYYLGDVDYQIKWRGDPRTDANDLFYLELKNQDKVMIRSYQNEISFSGAFSGSMKARKVVL